MKTILFSLTLSCIAFNTFAQNRVGIFAGGQATASLYTIKNQKQENEHKYGFLAGVNMKVPFEGNLYFTPSLFYSQKGYKVTYNEFAYPPGVDAADNNTNIHTTELAAQLQYDLGSNPGHFFIRVGPSFDIQLSGKETFNLKAGGSISRNMKFSYGDYGRISANMLGHFGYETGGGFMVYMQYGHGMGSINNADLGPKIRHRAYSLVMGMYIKNKKIILDTRNRQ